MSKDPAFLMYSKDWLTDTAEYMPDEKGVYIDLLCYQHQNKGLPTETERLAKMVGLSHEVFLNIWKVISHHFEQTDNRLVNQKLNRIMKEREEKSKVNTITGTFASLLRLGNYEKKIYKYLKSNFKANDFIEYNKNELTERLTEWMAFCLKSIGDGNGDEDKDVLLIKGIDFKKDFQEIFLKWLRYKRKRGESYKDKDSTKLAYQKLLKLSGENPDTAIQIIEQSMANNWAGLFALRNDTGIKKETPAAKYVRERQENG